MKVLAEYADIFRFITAVASVIVLLGGARLFMWIRKYFPERHEAITPEQLRIALEAQSIVLCDKIEKTDFTAREGFNTSVGRVQTAFELEFKHLLENVTEMKDSMILAHRKASNAEKEAMQANHKAELISKDVTRLEQVLLEKIEHLTTIAKRRDL